MFEKYNNYIIEEIMAIDLMFDAYVGIYNKRVEDINLINMAPAFWRMVIYAFFNNSILMLAKLYDNDSDVISVNKYLNFVEQNGKFIYHRNTNMHIEIDKIRLRFKENENIVAKLKTVRDKCVAHNDKSVINRKIDLYKENNFTIGEINTLIQFVKDMINIFWSEYSNIYEILEATNKGDYEIVFDALKSYRELNI